VFLTDIENNVEMAIIVAYCKSLTSKNIKKKTFLSLIVAAVLFFVTTMLKKISLQEPTKKSLLESSRVNTTKLNIIENSSQSFDIAILII